MIHKTVLLVLERDGKYLLVKRNLRTYHGMWEFPGGHIDSGETPYKAAMREAEEEVGKSELEKKPATIFVHPVPAGEEGGRLGEHEHRCHVFQGRLIGGVRLSHEASEYRWLTPEQIKNLDITPYTKTALEKLGVMKGEN